MVFFTVMMNLYALPLFFGFAGDRQQVLLDSFLVPLHHKYGVYCEDMGYIRLAAYL